MTLTTLLIRIGIAAIIITLVVGFAYKKHKSWVMTFLQNYCGVLFIVSGFVKAVDPMGTAFKMEQYFAEFESVAEGSFLSFLAPIFPLFSSYAIAFSVFVIIVEIVLGLMLVLGSRSKFTSWAFLLLVGFFTVLTGFTYLTGHVPSEANFFEFGKWGPWVESNMKVTDCGCFGDFIKLVPFTSFMKDVVLMVPAIYFVFRHKDMHQLFTPNIRKAAIGLSIAGLLWYCLSNFVWNIPGTDFRPFKKGAEVAKIKQAEVDAASNVKIVGWKLKNKADGNVVELSNDVYMKQFKDYPKTEWEVFDQIKTQPTIARSKISDFEFMDSNGNDATEDFLNDPNYSIMIVSYKMDYETTKEKIMVTDTVSVFDEETGEEIDRKIIQSEQTVEKYIWAQDYKDKFTGSLMTFLNEANADGIKSHFVGGAATGEMLESFKKDINAPFKVYEADDILIKTIVRSNPGIILWKDGVLVDKWHRNKLPTYTELKKSLN